MREVRSISTRGRSVEKESPHGATKASVHPDGLAARRPGEPDPPVRQWVLAVPKRLRYFLQRDADLQGAALRLFLRAVEQCLRAHSPGSGPATRLGAVAFIHRFGSALNAHLHFHCVVIDGVFDATPTGGVVFHAATGLETNAIAQVQAHRCAGAWLARVRAPRPAAGR
jgi:hypothetical protein